MLFEGNTGGSEEYVLIPRVTFIVADIVRFYDVSPTLIFIYSGSKSWKNLSSSRNNPCEHLFFTVFSILSGRYF